MHGESLNERRGDKNCFDENLLRIVLNRISDVAFIGDLVCLYFFVLRSFDDFRC